MNQRFVIVTAVLLAHIGGLWALQNGLLKRAIEVVIPITVVADVIERAQPQADQPQASVPPTPAQKPVQAQRTPLPKDTPTPPDTDISPVVVDTPSNLAPVAEAKPVAPSTNTAVVAAPSTPALAVTPAATPKIELPSSKADYLNNPKTPYPTLSKRIGEQGLVVIRVLIETNGTASKADIRTSSGFDRLDSAALQAVLKWRYVPGKRNGEPQAMWFDVPVHFQLSQN